MVHLHLPTPMITLLPSAASQDTPILYKGDLDGKNACPIFKNKKFPLTLRNIQTIIHMTSTTQSISSALLKVPINS
ncbi:hypothetical protein BGZ57DRAFT_889711 [Hyaloscypha finlandica]|nr:hypothetical protein BGZ57DRAFT_889711 [Hyaloscypha finlandica]